MVQTGTVGGCILVQMGKIQWVDEVQMSTVGGCRLVQMGKVQWVGG